MSILEMSLLSQKKLFDILVAHFDFDRNVCFKQNHFEKKRIPTRIGFFYKFFKVRFSSFHFLFIYNQLQNGSKSWRFLFWLFWNCERISWCLKYFTNSSKLSYEFSSYTDEIFFNFIFIYNQLQNVPSKSWRFLFWLFWNYERISWCFKYLINSSKLSYSSVLIRT